MLETGEYVTTKKSSLLARSSEKVPVGAAADSTDTRCACSLPRLSDSINVVMHWSSYVVVANEFFSATAAEDIVSKFFNVFD